MGRSLHPGSGARTHRRLRNVALDRVDPGLEFAQPRARPAPDVCGLVYVVKSRMTSRSTMPSSSSRAHTRQPGAPEAGGWATVIGGRPGWVITRPGNPPEGSQLTGTV